MSSIPAPVPLVHSVAHGALLKEQMHVSLAEAFVQETPRHPRTLLGPEGDLLPGTQGQDLAVDLEPIGDASVLGDLVHPPGVAMIEGKEWAVFLNGIDGHRLDDSLLFSTRLQNSFQNVKFYYLHHI